MPDFNEQLTTIARLRAEARGHEEALQGARMRLRSFENRQARARRGQTIVSADRDAEVARLRAQMAQLDATLATLREEERELARQFDRIRERERLIVNFTQKLAALRNQAEELRQRLAELRRREPPPREQIERLVLELEALQRAAQQLEEAIRVATEELAAWRRREPELRRQLESVRNRMESLRADLQGLQGRIGELSQPAFDDPNALERAIGELKASADRNRTISGRVNRDLAEAIGGLYQADPHPRGPLAQLNDQIPFLLFPVRLETIFATATSPRGVAGTELRVRVYPDEIAVHTHEDTLTDREVDAGRLYWVELVVAAHLRSKRAQRQADAWRHLVDLFGGQRAAWVARNTHPDDWETLSATGETQSLIEFLHDADAGFFAGLLALALDAQTHTALTRAIATQDGDAFYAIAEQQTWGERINTAARSRIAGFPPADLIRTDAWSRAPRTRVLPDRFVLLLYQTENAAPQEIPGALIADTVFLGPDPLDPKETIVRKDNTMTLGGACEWMSDFDAAVEQGLGFRVPLTEQQASAGFARVAVLGLRLSATPVQGAQMLEELIGNHQFSPKGFSLVAQGTPTNNTERNGTGYSDNDPYDDQAFFTELDPPAFDPDSAEPLRSRTDGRVLADALGISYSTLQTVQNADQTDILEAGAMNTALFPATLGYWLKNWMSPVVTADAARLTRNFFTQHVSGRGPLPAIRVGNQPYGVLLTSDMSRWKYRSPEQLLATVAIIDQQTSFLVDLHRILLELEAHWTSLAKQQAHVGTEGSDSSDVLMAVLGLHPTSVEFYQRIGYHEHFLHQLESFTKPGKSYTNELASLMSSMPPTVRLYLENLGVTTTSSAVAQTLALHVLWLHYTTGLEVPSLVENKPASEVATLAFNYIDWLAKADSAGKIIREEFTATKPAALLYLMLRNALLLQLHQGAYDWLKERGDFEPALQQALTAAPIMPGVHSSISSISKFELMSVAVDTVQLAHPAPGTSVADWIWGGPVAAEEEAAFVRTQRAALEQLAPAATARLERCLVEHLDCLQYRLDAWETGLFAQRLQAQRRSGSEFFDRQMGIYLGAFGWVEGVTRTTRVALRREDLPSVLRPADDGPLLEEDDVASTSATPVGSKRGGYTHAPSINHAAAAALLRNAYLSHANSAQADVLSNNLSSERVRRAQFVLEGMRNGQPIEALLGYQFERSLHDRTSESAARGDVPVLELNQFIQPYREAFPFESREIPQAGTGVASETVPPYSVVNGLSLMTATLDASNGHGLASVLTAAELPGANQAAAVLAVRDGLVETLDAVKDLLTAENAYQLVQGNFDRVAAVSLAQKDARIPPTLEVLNTPRGSRFTFTQRVTLHFENRDPSLSSSNPWPGIDMTARALAEPGVNFWLGSVLGGPPSQVSCKVWRIEKAADGTETARDEDFVTLGDLNIQPVDFVAITGINVTDSQGGATELETRIGLHYRDTHGVPLDATVRIDFDPANAPGTVTFAQVFPLARRLRGLLGECRVLDARDFLPAAGGKASTIPVDKTNPGGCDVAELRARVLAARAALTALADALDGSAAPTVNLLLRNDVADPADDEPFAGPLGDAFAKLDQAGVDFIDTATVKVTFSMLGAESLYKTLHGVAQYGISDSLPPEPDFTSDGAKVALLSRARRVARRLRRTSPADGVLDRANAFIAAATPDKPLTEQVSSLLQAGQVLFSETLKCLPQFTCWNEVDLAATDAARAQLLSHALSAAPGLSTADIVDEWLQGLARVRPRIHAWETVRTLADALHDVEIRMFPVQVPYRDEDRWLAVEFPEKDPLDSTKAFGISRDTLSITAHGATAFQAGAPQRGLLLDEWTEEIPTSGENTGISFRFNQPNAVPPQTLLLAVTSEETGSWSWNDLVGILNDTLARAKRRAVEPAQLEKDGLIWNALAPALVSEFSTVQPADVSLDYLVAARYAQLDDFYAAISHS